MLLESFSFFLRVKSRAIYENHDAPIFKPSHVKSLKRGVRIMTDGFRLYETAKLAKLGGRAKELERSEAASEQGTETEKISCFVSMFEGPRAVW